MEDFFGESRVIESLMEDFFGESRVIENLMEDFFGEFPEPNLRGMMRLMSTVTSQLMRSACEWRSVMENDLQQIQHDEK